LLISIVIPCFNEEEVLEETFRRLDQATRSIRSNARSTSTSNEGEDIRFEFIFVNDGSTDRTLDLLLAQTKINSEVRVINFARNFGHQVAVSAGIDASNGDASILMDADLQDPPEVIIQMIELWKQGYDVVYATRLERPGETKFKRLTAHWFYKTLNTLSDTQIPLDTGDFRLMSRKVTDSIRAMPEHDRFIRGMVSWVGFRQTSIKYRRAERYAGQSKYPLRKMLAFATTGILSFSSQPLRFATWCGLGSSAIAAIGSVYVLIVKLMTDQWVAGWASVILAVLFIGGVQLFCLGMLGEYIGRIYSQSKQRPLYIVEGYYGYQGRESKPKLSRSPVIDVK
jgi:dolichol-phosphate mannosyltransferase